MSDLRPSSWDYPEVRKRADALCAAGHHGEELAVWTKALAHGNDPVHRHHLGTCVALTHVMETAHGTERVALAQQLLAIARERIELEDARMDLDRTRPATRRDNHDSTVRYLRVAEEALGLEPSERSADLTRRELNRASRPRRRSTWTNMPSLEVVRREEKRYWHDFYVQRHGREPPDGWWMENPRRPSGGQTHPDLGLDFPWYDPEVSKAFWAEMRRLDRLENPRPERWRSEAALAACVAEVLPGHEVVRQARPAWLGTQTLDVYVPSLKLAFEYQGEQHYYPLPHLGGVAGLENRKQLDAAKGRACRRAGVRLILWRYDRDVTPDAVRRRIGTRILEAGGSTEADDPEQPA